MRYSLPRKTYYERFGDRLAADPAYWQRAAEPPAAMADFTWLAGDWTWEMHIRATPSTPERKPSGPARFTLNGFSIWIARAGLDPVPFLTYDAFQHLWVLTMADRLSYGVMKSRGWRDGAAVFEGVMTFMGVELALRQTWRRVGEEVHLTNEEFLDGEYYLIDTIVYRRV